MEQLGNILWFIILSINLNYNNAEQTRPHIIFMVADDLGFNDVGFHGSNEVPTPNIDALAYNGIILNRHYVLPTCTPSRAALMTGKYPIRTGMQGPPLNSMTAAGLPLNETLLPEYLKKLGYTTHLIGKWHLGYYKTEYTPTKRGFDTHLGYYNGWVRYNDSVSTSRNIWGIDARSNLDKAGDRFKGKYSTDVYTEEAVNLIKNHDPSVPLFLDLSHTAVHACANNEMQVRNKEENDIRFSYIKDPQRRGLAGILSTLDESVGTVIKSLYDNNMLENSILIFMSDNGGATIDKIKLANSASNWPLRGYKGFLTDGGVRGAAAIWSPLLSNMNTVSHEFIHITDWLPTLYAAAGGKSENLGDLDGVNQWPYLTGLTNSSQRDEILVNIDEIKNEVAIIKGGWKYIRTNASVSYLGDSGRSSEYNYNMTEVIGSQTNEILSKFNPNSRKSSIEDLFLKIRTDANIEEKCSARIDIVNSTDFHGSLDCFNTTGCLFHLKSDPCEFYNMHSSENKIVVDMQKRIDYFNSVLVKQVPTVTDPKANPKYYDFYWTSWVVDPQETGFSPSVRSASGFIIVFSAIIYILLRIFTVL